jgi:signal transduction histidine kinase/ActR/RegA family two-component response regulator
MSAPRMERLLAFARQLQRANSFTDLLDITRTEVIEALGYRHVWMMVAENDDATELRLLDYSGDRSALVWEVAPVLPVTGDRFLEEIVASETPVVIEDARVDPRTNKDIVEKLENRTLINLPLRLIDRPLGVFGLGTFGDEGCRAPTPPELDYLVGMAGQLTVAASRLRLLEAEKRAADEKRELERRILQIQKLESLGLLAGGIAHDFNNLLTVILSTAALADTMITDPAPKTELRALQDAALRARDLTSQLLAMSRAQELALAPLDVNQRVAELVELARRVLPESIHLDFISGAHIPLVEADKSQLDQVLMNLFVNARDAMPDGGKLTIETQRVLVSGDFVASHPWAKIGRYALLTVTDTGCGMSAEVLERVFEPFFTTKAPRAGTGLGLAVAYGIVRQHGGMMHCYSEPNVGTVFKIYLPAHERLASDVGVELEKRVRTGKENILVAEDDELVRNVTRKILARAGFRVTVVDDGEQACRAVAGEDFDLVVLDVVMPGLTCREVIERIRTLRPHLPIQLASGYTAGANVAELVEMTGIELLPKPFDPDRLLRAVQGALEARRT